MTSFEDVYSSSFGRTGGGLPKEDWLSTFVNRVVVSPSEKIRPEESRWA